MYIFGVTGSIRKAGDGGGTMLEILQSISSQNIVSPSKPTLNPTYRAMQKRNPFWKTSFFGVLDRKMLVVLHSHQKTLLNEEHSIQPTVLSTWTAAPRWSLARVLNERNRPTSQPTIHPRCMGNRELQIRGRTLIRTDGISIFEMKTFTSKSNAS